MSGTSVISSTAAYRLAYQISPIMLVGGIASGTTGNTMPIVQLTGYGDGQNNYFAEYLVLPGGTLINQTVATYPFANQQVAANATIQQPNVLSLHMIAPVNIAGGYQSKLATFTALQQSLQQHNNAGGLYNVATPSFIYTNGLLTAMTHLPSSGSDQQQIEWQLDFFFPLITLQQADAAQTSMIAKATNQQPVTGQPAWSGSGAGAGSSMPGATQNITGQPGAVANPQGGS